MLDGLHEFTLSLVEVFVFWFRKLREPSLIAHGRSANITTAVTSARVGREKV